MTATLSDSTLSPALHSVRGPRQWRRRLALPVLALALAHALAVPSPR